MQVCYNLDAANTRRAVNGPMSAMNILGLSHGTIVTFNNSYVIVKDGKPIEVVTTSDFYK